MSFHQSNRGSCLKTSPLAGTLTPAAFLFFNDFSSFQASIFSWTSLFRFLTDGVVLENAHDRVQEALDNACIFVIWTSVNPVGPRFFFRRLRLTGRRGRPDISKKLCAVPGNVLLSSYANKDVEVFLGTISMFCHAWLQGRSRHFLWGAVHSLWLRTVIVVF